MRKVLYTVKVMQSPKPAELVKFYSPRQAMEFMTKMLKKGAKASMSMSTIWRRPGAAGGK